MPLLISVIVVAYNASPTIRHCLAALRRQTDSGFEVIVVDSSSDDTASLVQTEFPEARIIHSDMRLYPGAARNRGIQAAWGEIIAFVDSDCVAAPNWVETLRRTYADPSTAAVGGAVIPANPESRVGWSAWFCEFSSWAPAGEVRAMRDIPTCNISYRAAVLQRVGPFREHGYCSDTALNWKLTNAGYTLVFHPDLVVAHFNLTSIRRFLWKQKMHGNAFSRMRCEERHFTVARRAIYAVGCSMLPILAWMRMLRRELPPGYDGQAWRSMPVIVAGLLAWTWGEALGYVRP